MKAVIVVENRDHGCTCPHCVCCMGALAPIVYSTTTWWWIQNAGNSAGGLAA